MNSKFAMLALAAATLAAPALPVHAAELTGDAITKSLLREPEFESIAISPDGTKLAIVRRVGDAAQVAVHNRADMTPIIAFDPGSRGRISQLRWLDDNRLLVGATRLGGPEGFALFEPVLVIASLDGKPPVQMPWDFFGVIPGDTEHLLVGDCSFGPGNKGCNQQQVRRDEIGKLNKKGELVIEGPPEAHLIVNGAATTGFALEWKDDDTSRTFVYQPADKTWKLLNDGSVANLDVIPIGVSRDGKTGYLETEHKEGPDTVESYDFATGKRTALYTDPNSDPLGTLATFDANEMIGAWYEPTDPKPHFWAPEQPEAQMYTELAAAFPGRNVSVLSHSKDNNWLVLGVDSDREPGTWFLFDRKARKASAIARQYPWIEPAAQATQRSVQLKSRDGLTLHGILTLPPNSTGKNLPLVINPHGGPYWTHDSKGFDSDGQILAQHGYAVLQVNFRGSDGYGRSFFDAGTRQWGRKMQDDLTDATKWAIAEGIADPARVCIYGMSYGGYASLMGPIREPGLYKCAASYAGPSDLTRLAGWGSSRNNKLTKKWFVKMVGEGDELTAISPSMNADKVKVPMLIAHGYRDARVDVRHAQAMHKQLEKNGVPVDYIEYSETGHYLMLEKHREDFYTRLLRLLDQNIGPNSAAARSAPAAAAATAGAH